MRQDEVNHHRLQTRRKIGKGVDGLLHQRNAHVDVAQQHALGGVLEAGLPAQFLHLADVVQKHAGQQQVAIEQRIVRGHFFGQSQQAHHMLQQAAKPGVMQLARGRRFAIRLGQ